MPRILLCCLLATGLAAADAAEAPTPPEGFSTARPQITIETSEGPIVAELFADQAPQTVRTVIELAEGLRASEKGGETAEHHFYDGLTFHRVIPDFMIQGGCPEGDGSGCPGFAYRDEINADSLGLDQAKALAGEQLHPQCAYMQAQFMEVMVRPKMEAAGIGPETPRPEAQAAFKQALEELDGTSLKAFYQALGYAYDDDLPASSKPVRGSLAMANSGPDTNGSQFFINVADTPHLTGKHTVFGRVLDGMAVVDAISKLPTAAGNRPQEPVTIESVRLTTPEDPGALFIDAGTDETSE